MNCRCGLRYLDTGIGKPRMGFERLTTGTDNPYIGSDNPGLTGVETGGFSVKNN
jgi:hypothetical protein